VLSSFSSFLFSWFILIKFQARPREGHLVSLNSTLVYLKFSLSSFTTFKTSKHSKIFFILAFAGYYSLFPLLFEDRETILKTVILALYLILLHHFTLKSYQSIFSLVEKSYMFGYIPLFIYCQYLHSILFKGTLEFLPLMLTSVYCAVGVVSCWMMFYVAAMSDSKTC
jgi:alpha-1,3-glucosyltransferase